MPLELDEMYPFAQSIFPEFTDLETEKYISKIFEEFIGKKEIRRTYNAILWELSEGKKRI